MVREGDTISVQPLCCLRLQEETRMVCCRSSGWGEGAMESGRDQGKLL